MFAETPNSSSDLILWGHQNSHKILYIIITGHPELDLQKSKRLLPTASHIHTFSHETDQVRRSFPEFYWPGRAPFAWHAQSAHAIKLCGLQITNATVLSATEEAKSKAEEASRLSEFPSLGLSSPARPSHSQGHHSDCEFALVLFTLRIDLFNTPYCLYMAVKMSWCQFNISLRPRIPLDLHSRQPESTHGPQVATEPVVLQVGEQIEGLTIFANIYCGAVSVRF